MIGIWVVLNMLFRLAPLFIKNLVLKNTTLIGTTGGLLFFTTNCGKKGFLFFMVFFLFFLFVDVDEWKPDIVFGVFFKIFD